MQTCRQPNMCSIKVAMVKKTWSGRRAVAAQRKHPPVTVDVKSGWIGLGFWDLTSLQRYMCLQFCQRRNLRRIRTPSAYRETWDRVWRLPWRGHSVSWTAATASWRRFDVARFFAHFPSISCRFPSPHRKPMWTDFCPISNAKRLLRHKNVACFTTCSILQACGWSTLGSVPVVSITKLKQTCFHT